MEENILETIMKTEINSAEGGIIELGEIVDEEDFWFVNKGDQSIPIIKHVAVNRIRRSTGAMFKEYKQTHSPDLNNNKGFGYIVACEFPNGEISYGHGEANEISTRNNNIAKGYKETMAIKRAEDRAVLKSDYLALDEVLYSEIEADEFSQSVSEKEKLKKEIAEKDQLVEKYEKRENKWEEFANSAQDKLIEKNDLISQLINHVHLPEKDEVYPGICLLDVVWEDEEYAEKIKNEYENESIRYATRILLNAKKEADEEQSNELNEYIEYEYPEEEEGNVEGHSENVIFDENGEQLTKVEENIEWGKVLGEITGDEEKEDE